jgi:glucose-6-phosphate 1-dehydrogenase
LLIEALKGDASLFMRADQVEEAWKIVTPILNAWKKQPAPKFPNYIAGSWGPKAAEQLIKEQKCTWTLLPENKSFDVKETKK